MLIDDLVYGQCKINEAVLVETIHSRPLQRLKLIAQYGVPQWFWDVPGFSRYEHSVGVMLLLRKLGAGMEEQLSGLTHDVSHTAFSHVTDRIFGDPFQGHPQDERHFDFLMASELFGILKRHGFDPARVADIEAHPLLEREAPDLCADRIDYSLREFYFGALNGTLSSYVESLRVVDGRIVFDNQQTAESFARHYLVAHSRKWAGLEKTVKQHLFAELLKTALRENVISISDLFEDDDYVMRKLASSTNKKIRAEFMRLTKPVDINTKSRDAIELRRRQRHVDPEFLKDGRLVRVSEANEKYRALLQKQKNIHSRPLRVSILPSPPIR